ncbi:methyltransferase domain-containing protein [Streptomyces sp. NPDC048424]|uniref:methyltransferase domain-containing protein n=1 Tax=Streptomyces sp. NPDC048424 TaxID=3155265 RepID=UPI0034141A2F
MSDQITAVGAQEAGAEAPPSKEVAGFYNDLSGLLTELFGGSLHEGYWTSSSDPASMAEASRQLTDLLVGKMAVKPGDRVLDLGCGSGAPAVRLAQTTGAQVVGITNSAVQIEAAVRNAQEAGLGDQVAFRCADATVLDYEEQSFDAVLMIESIFHLPDRLGALRQVARVLKPGGRVALTDLLDLDPAPDPMRQAVGDLAEHSREHGHSPLVAKPIRLEEYASLLERAGLVPVEGTDVTEHTVARTLDCLRRKLTDDHEELVRKYGGQVVRQYETVLPLLERAGFGYGVVVAQAPA